MKKLAAILGTIVLITFTGTAFGEVTIKSAPLKWEDVANLDGDEVFNNLCSTCHGTGGRGDGPAASALNTGVPDLTILAAKNGGVYAHRQVKAVISGKHRVVANGTIDMPMWGEQFMYVRPGPGINSFPHRYFARERINTLSTYIEGLQVN